MRLSIRKGDYINFVDKSKPEVFVDKIAETLREKLNNEFDDIMGTRWWFKGWLDYDNLGSFKDYFLDNYQKVNKINEWLKEQEKDKNSGIATLAKEIKDYKTES